MEELLIDSYKINFQLSLEQCINICKEKLNLLSGYLIEGSAIILGAFKDEILIGFLWLFKHKYFNETRLHVNHIVVSNHFRGRGIGKKLMKEVEKQAKKLELQTIDLFVSESNTEAINMYLNMNYETERRYLKKTIGETYDVFNS